ncbi:hypothetical protein SDC9_172467 [bioreactor metagenome]|uniref:Uncharacterized protein n=1 Tax=bioreactor metagenome TaxID=1076179 RepID=A0A645GG09_9ZZZZ
MQDIPFSKIVCRHGYSTVVSGFLWQEACSTESFIGEVKVEGWGEVLGVHYLKVALFLISVCKQGSPKSHLGVWCLCVVKRNTFLCVAIYKVWFKWFEKVQSLPFKVVVSLGCRT